MQWANRFTPCNAGGKWAKGYRVLGRKAKLECKYATAVDAHQLRNAEYRVSGPKNRENAWPQGYAEIQ
eukprot:scaffold13248_cov97-Phaeocystis_antarctica.AAC.2